MKLHHKINHGWVRPSEPITDRYAAEIEAARQRAEKACRQAERSAQRAERQSERSPSPEAFRARDDARMEVLRRYDELREIEALMQQAPATGQNWSGTGSVRNPLPKGSQL
jgi:hypothetical protein